MKIKLSPSVLGANFENLASEIRAIDDNLIDSWHIDVMDGRFVDNFGLTPQVAKIVSNLSRKPLDVHLMVKECDYIIPLFAMPGVRQILVHPESTTDLSKTCELIKSHNMMVGIVLNPNCTTKMEEIYEKWPHLVPLISSVMVMTVHPGKCGQLFLHEQLEVIRKVRSLLDQRGSSNGAHCELIVDGGITHETAPLSIKAGATALVAGSAAFKGKDYNDNLQQLLRGR